MRILFRAAAGPRLGFGHLVRCRSIARALGVTPAVSIRGSLNTRSIAAARGWEVRPDSLDLLQPQAAPDVLVVDDPSPADARRWVGAARRRRVPVATLHDLGLGFTDSDLPIDGSIDAHRDATHATLAGPMFAVLDPAIPHAREDAAQAARGGVLVALGGGAHIHRVGARLAAALVAALPHMAVRIIEGFTRPGRQRGASPDVTWVAAPNGLASELSRASIVVVAGGMTLYEAAALGRPAVALAVVPAQRATIAGFARRGAAIDAGLMDDEGAVPRVTEAVAALASDVMGADRLGATAARLVDGRGVFRVADALRELASRRTGEASHAA